MEDLDALNARFWEARQYKDRWLALYKELYFYVIPDRDAFNVKFNYRDDGKPVTQQIWDNTAMLAAYKEQTICTDCCYRKIVSGDGWYRSPHLP